MNGDPRGARDRRLRGALEILAEVAREDLARHPQGHLVNGSRADLELTLSLPLGTAQDITEETIAGVGQALSGELDTLLEHRAAFRAGRVHCLRCATTDCEHAAPASSRQVFAGYGPSGIPQFMDFGQWLLERQHPRVDALYRKPPELITELTSGADLSRELLDAFRDQRNDYRIHGQVTAGWFPVPRATGGRGTLALTFQVVSVTTQQGKKKGWRRLALNLLGTGPDGEPLRDLYDRLPALPWTEAVNWGHSVLQSIERSQKRAALDPKKLSRRVQGVLQSIARHLEHDRRARERRTDHAQKRHTQGDRPTPMARRDLARASGDSILYDERRQTLVVLGQKGRAHVFSPEGKLVTSVRYSTESIERKKKLGLWRLARGEEIGGLRDGVAGTETEKTMR